MTTPFSSPAIGLPAVEAPLSDGGKWLNLFLDGPGDGVDVGTFPSSPHQASIGSGQTGHGFVLRTTDPDATYDQELCFSAFGGMNPFSPNVSVLLRADYAGNFYQVGFFQDPDDALKTRITIRRWDSFTFTLLANVDVGVLPVDVRVGGRAIGSEISGWIVGGTGFAQRIAVTDTSFPYGLIGFGAEGFGVVDPLALDNFNGGKVTGERASQVGVFTPPILIPYLKPTVHKS